MILFACGDTAVFMKWKWSSDWIVNVWAEASVSELHGGPILVGKELAVSGAIENCTLLAVENCTLLGTRT